MDQSPITLYNNLFVTHKLKVQQLKHFKSRIISFCLVHHDTFFVFGPEEKKLHPTIDFYP